MRSLRVRTYYLCHSFPPRRLLQPLNETDLFLSSSFSSLFSFSRPSTVDRHLYFVHALPSDATSISLPELHGLLEDYINRNENEMAELEKERNARSWRKTEGKGKRETEMDKQREVETAEYKSGFSAFFLFTLGFFEMEDADLFPQSSLI
jgi:hypothetical protein